MQDRRLIEETFPVREVSEESSKEKNIRHGHISTLHIWWARRPLASSRATNYASLIQGSNDEKDLKTKKDFISKLCKWENSLNYGILEKAKKDILQSNDNRPPRVLDVFAGGGSIPLEALRLGCETYAIDYNPVANLLLRCTLEYPQKYGGQVEKAADGFLSAKRTNKLLQDVRKWGDWVLAEARTDVDKYYPIEKDGSIVVGYIWTRTIPCQNPSCNAEIPLMRQFWLSKKNDKKVALYPTISGNKITFKIVGNGYSSIPKNFNPDGGTISKAIATCLACGSIVDDTITRRLFSQGKSREKMLVVVSTKEGQAGKRYRIATDEDWQIFAKAGKYLEKKREVLLSEQGIDPVPDEAIHTPDNKEYEPGNLLYNFTPVLLYGKTKWRDLFNPRQLLSLVVFSDKVRNSYNKMIEAGYDSEYAKVITSYLALVVNRLADKNATLVVYNAIAEKVEHVFGRQALSMVWDYIEVNPFTDVGWPNMQEWVELVIDHCSQVAISSSAKSVKIVQASATQVPFPDNYFDAIFTDPPYYDNVPYADLSDFFYVWLKRTVGNLYPELFSTPLTPKSGEAIAELPLLRGMGKEKAAAANSNVKTSAHFEKMLQQAFKEINRALKPNGIAIVVYAHKSTAGWETLINSILDSGLVVTAAWPIHTERKSRLRSQESAALASSIYMVSRKIQRTPTGFYKDVKDQLRRHLNDKLSHLWREGISGADFFIAAIGSAIEVFGKFDRIIDDEGNVIRADRMLNEIRRVVIDYAVKEVLHNGFAEEISQLTRFYVLWRWAYGESALIFDDALKLAQSVGLDLEREWNRGFIEKEKEFIKILGPEDRKLEELKNSKELIDVLHYVLLLWKKGRNEDTINILKTSGFGKTDVFYRVAQAISEPLPNESKEKKLLEGFLAGKERLAKDVRKGSGQQRLDE